MRAEAPRPMLHARHPNMPDPTGAKPSHSGGLQAHEWEKHGTCAEELFPREVDFFNATLSLHAAANLQVSRIHTSVQPASL